MGLTVENVHVFVEGDFPGGVRNRVAETAKDFLRSQGYEEVASASEADRTLTLGPAEGRRWISVFDTETGAGSDLAKALSKEGGKAAVSMMVFDSDDIFLKLAEGGKIAAVLERSEGKTRREGLQRWAPYAELDALRNAFAAEPLFAEEQLARLAEALGIESELCLTPSGEAEGEKFRHLYFRHKTSSRSTANEAAGPPVFQIAQHHNRPFELGVGERLWGSLGAYAANTGGPGTGVRIKLGGPAIEEGLIRVDSVLVFQPARPERMELALDQDYAISVPGLHLDGGVEVPESGNLLQRVLQPRNKKKVTGQRANIVTVNLSGTATAVGSGILRLTFEPLENVRAGAATQSFQIVVRPAVRVPLKADATVPGTQLYMRLMAEPSHVTAIAALAPSPSARAAALGAIEEWAEFLPALRPETWHVLQTGSNAFALTKEYRSGSNNLLTDKLWKKVRSKFEQGGDCSGHMGEEASEGGESLAGCAGWGFDSSSASASILPVRFAPQLSFWLDTRVFRDEETKEAETILAAIFDKLLREGHLLQAFQTRWKCGDLSSVSMTLYEVACGVQGQCTTSEFWCKRYLRGVGQKVWLGADLAGHLPAGSLGAFTPLPLGEGVRLTDVPNQNLDGLEAMLAPILAGKEQWMEGMRNLYRP